MKTKSDEMKNWTAECALNFLAPWAKSASPVKLIPTMKLFFVLDS